MQHFSRVVVIVLDSPLRKNLERVLIENDRHRRRHSIQLPDIVNYPDKEHLSQRP
jgi:hypothetical protein